MKPLNPIFKVINLTLLGILLTSALYSQSVPLGSVSGKVRDSISKVLLESASVKLLRAKDSVLVTSVLTNASGEFVISNQPPAEYLIKISFIGYKIVVKPVSINSGKLNTDIGMTELTEGISLDAVVVLGEPPAVTVNGDTTSFNSSAYKTTPDAMAEDLIKKLPGMEVDKSGNIKSNGDPITKVTVDGRDFFGNDPKMATRNLPADAIAKTQVIEERTEESKAKGIDDGKRIKTLNLVLKEDKKRGWFGNSAFAGGTSDRYHGSLSANHFDKDKQLNFLLMSNNISQGFNTEDATAFSGGSGAGTSYMINGNGEISAMTIGGVSVGNSPGLSKTNSGGINFSDAWGKKNTIKFNASYNASATSTETERQTAVQKIQPTGTFFNNSTSTGENANQSHRFNFRITAAIDSLTNLSFTPALTFGLGNSSNLYNSAESNSDGQKLNDVHRNSHSDSFTPSLNGSFSLSRSFKQKKGSMSLYAYNYTNGNSSDNFNESVNNYYQKNYQQEFNRLESSEYNYGNFDISNTVSRVIDKKKSIRMSWTAGYGISSNRNNRNTLEYNPLTAGYEILVDSLSNNSLSRTYRYSSGLGISRTASKWNAGVTANLQNAALKGAIKNNTIAEKIEKDYWSILPQVSFSYRPKTGVSYSLSTSASLSPPSMTYLQTIQNNTSPLYISEGNPDLKPSKYYYSSLRYSFSDPKKNKFTNLSLSFTKTVNSTNNSRNFDSQTGITRSKPLNVNGNYSLSFTGSFNVPTKIKDLRISPGITALSSRNVGFIDGLKNNTDRLNGGITLNLSYAYKEFINLTFNSRNSYEHANNSARSTVNNSYFNLRNTLNLSLEPVKTWRITIDVLQQSYSNQSVVLFTPGIKKFFMDKRQLSAELSGFDIFNQNSDITRSIYENQITDTRTNNVRQYFYLKLVYKVNKLGTASRPSTPVLPSGILIR